MRADIPAYILLSSLVLLSRDGLAELAEKSGTISGASHVNLRSGPGISHPPIKILRNGEKVDVERLEGSWYAVSLADGNRGYVYKPLVYLAAEEKAELPRDERDSEQELKVSKAVPATQTNGTENKDNPEVSPRQPEVSSAKGVERESPTANAHPPPNLKREDLWVIARWLGAFLSIFVLGWVLGGNYYLRRDKIERTKLHF